MHRRDAKKDLFDTDAVSTSNNASNSIVDYNSTTPINKGFNSNLKSFPYGEYLVKVHLPNQQHTTVRIIPGWTVREALSKALKLRKLEPEMCQAYRVSNDGETKQPIDWDVDVAMLKGHEISVETRDRFPMTPQISHNFAKLAFALTKCQFCHEFLMIGIRCLTCGIEFHRQCAREVPALCKPKYTDDDQYRYLLARQNKFSDPDLDRINHNNLFSDSAANTFKSHHPSADMSFQNDQHHLSNYPEHHPLSPSQLSQNREWLEEKWEIDGEEIIQGQRIGQGSFATVYRGHWHGPVALKKLNVENPSQKQLQNFRNEVVLLRKIRHPNVLLFSGYVLKPQLIIVTQWCKGLSLHKHLHVEDKRDFTTEEIKKISIGIAQGMDYLHFKGIIHRDLKSNNIFIHDEGDLSVKIGDFGLATFRTHFEGDQPIYHPTGSILWMAPEVIRCEKGVNPFTQRSDVYSYGIVLYELLSRKLPYFDFKHKDALLYLIGLGHPTRSPKLNLDVINRVKPNELKSLMLDCTERIPRDRPLFKQILDELKNIKVNSIIRSNSEPLRLNNLNGSIASDLMNY